MVLGAKVNCFASRQAYSRLIANRSDSGYLTLHTLVMLMKTHSYISFNGTAAEKRRQLRKKTALLDTAVKEAGGWQKVLATVAKQHGQVQEDAESAGSAVQTGSAPVRRFSTGDIALGTSSSLNAPLILQRRRRSASKGGVMQPSSVPLPSNESIQDPRLLVEFGDENIYNLANDCVDLKEDLSIADQVDAQWPANLTYANYVDYLLVPTLVYEQSYPRTSTIRPIYVLEKTLATFGTFFVVYAITEHVIFPTHEAALANPIRANNFLLTALDLVLPFIINYLLIFYIIFECVCNGFAEFTRFADRGFYDDWWNAVTWDEFARKWNKPVHQVSWHRCMFCYRANSGILVSPPPCLRIDNHSVPVEQIPGFLSDILAQCMRTRARHGA